MHRRGQFGRSRARWLPDFEGWLWRDAHLAGHAVRAAARISRCSLPRRTPHHQPRLRAAQSVSRADSGTCPLPRPIRSPKSVPDTVFPSRRAASFDLIRHWHHGDGAFLYAFDVIELNGDDLRRDPLIVRKATLASVLARAAPGLRLRPKRRDLRAGADQLWIELGINRLADAGTAA